MSQDEVTPKRQRDATLQSQKDNLRQMEAQEEQRLARGQREYLDLEIRKFRRKKLLIFHSLEQELLREVRVVSSVFQSANNIAFTNVFNIDVCSNVLREKRKKKSLSYLLYAGIEQAATATRTGTCYALATS